MLSLLKKLFGSKPAETTAEAPYKVEAPVKDLADIALAQQATQAVVESIAPAAEPKKKPAPKKAPAKATAKKAPAKKAPKQPKK